MKARTPARPRLPDFARDLAARLDRLRARHAAVALATGIAMALSAVVAWLVAECPSDFLLALPWWFRGLCLAAGLGGAGAFAWRCGVRPFRARPDDHSLALMIERAVPAFRSRYIASVQLAHDASPLVRALVAETTALARTAHFGAVIDTASLRRWLKIAVVAVFIGLGLWFAGGKNSAPLLRRAFLSTEPVPRKTKIDMLTGSRVIAVGDDFKIEANVGGVIPPAGRLHVKTARAQEFPFDSDPAQRAHFSRTLASVQEPFDYFVALGDARSATFHVKAQPRPAIVSIEATQHFPAYTKLPPRRRALNDLKLLAGSRLALRVKAGTRIKSGAIRLLADQKPLRESPLQPDANDPSQLSGDIVIPVKKATGLALHLVDEDGLESRATAVYRIEIIPDRPPTVKIRWPDRREELLTAGATMLLAFEAKDDFGIAKIRLHYAIDWAEGAAFRSIDLDLGDELPRDLVRRFDWKIARLQPPASEGQVIDYWLEALDANDPAGIGSMEHYQARIVSEIEKRADLANRLSDTIEGLNEVRQRQEDVNARLGEIIFEKPPASP